VSETTASEAMASNPPEGTLAAGGSRESSVVAVIQESAADAEEVVFDSEPAVDVELDELPVIIPPPAPTGFQAILQHANLHSLLQIENLSRTTGVFLVVSQGRRGYLHLSNGELIHAECGPLTGEPAAAEILSWVDGEFKSCARALATVATIHSSLQALLLRLARDSDEAAQSERRPPPLPRPIEEDKPTEPHLPALGPDSQRRSSSSQAPRSSRLPPPLPPRIERESANVAEVLISPSGELVQGRGIGPDEFSARVAYAARLAELIGRAIRSGSPRALELKGKGTQTTVKWQADGSLSATLELVQSARTR
jgi:Domain of unknown function (DUF4388)